MDYTSYLKSAHWDSIKKAYKKSGYPQYCMGCKNSKFQLHHKTYKNIGNEPLEDLMPLCKHCHTAVHAYFNAHPKQPKNTLQALKKIKKQDKREHVRQNKLLQTQSKLLCLAQKRLQELDDRLSFLIEKQ
jgi:formate-dependent nitrite reductase cytochrome c552 subunit